MSKLGPHLHRMTPDALAWIASGPPLARLSGDFAAARALAEAHPTALLIGAPPVTLDLSDEARSGAGPEGSARLFVAGQRETLLKYPQITAWEGPLAPVLGAATSPEALRLMAWYAAFEAERVRALADLGLRAVIGNFASGGPDLKLWAAFVPALDAAEDHAGLLGLQEHGAPWLWWLTGAFQPSDGPRPELATPAEGPAGWTTLRYRLVRERVLRPNGLERLSIVITSVRLDRSTLNDLRYPTGPWRALLDFWRLHDGADDPIEAWRESTDPGARDPERYLAEQLLWYDAELQRDPEVLGAAVGIVGADPERAAYDLAGTSVCERLYANPGIAGSAASFAPRVVPRGPEPIRLTRENLLDRRGFDEGWIVDQGPTQELAAPLGWRLRHVSGIADRLAEDGFPACGRPFATLLGSPDLRPLDRERLLGGTPFVWRVAARTPFHLALEQTLTGLVPGLSHGFSVRVLAEPIVREQPRAVYAPDLAASEVRVSVWVGDAPSFPHAVEPALATTGWLGGAERPFGRYGEWRVTFDSPADPVTVRLEIRSRFALPLAVWHILAPQLVPLDVAAAEPTTQAAL